jgi:hypothetical protein
VGGGGGRVHAPSSAHDSLHDGGSSLRRTVTESTWPNCLKMRPMASSSLAAAASASSWLDLFPSSARGMWPTQTVVGSSTLTSASTSTRVRCALNVP